MQQCYVKTRILQIPFSLALFLQISLLEKHEIALLEVNNKYNFSPHVFYFTKRKALHLETSRLHGHVSDTRIETRMFTSTS